MQCSTEITAMTGMSSRLASRATSITTSLTPLFEKSKKQSGALNTKLRMPRLAFAARARPVALRRQARRHGDQRWGREEDSESHASTINLTFLALDGRGARGEGVKLGVLF